MNSRDKRFMYEGGQTAYYLDLVVPSGTIYPHIATTIQTPILDGAPIYDICRVRIVHVGRHFPCWGSTYNNHSSSDMISSLGDGVNDRATVNLTLVSNGGGGEYWWNKNDSVVRIEVVLRGRKHDTAVNGSWYDTVFTVDYGGGVDWSQTASLKYNTTNPDLTSVCNFPLTSILQHGH